MVEQFIEIPCIMKLYESLVIYDAMKLKNVVEFNVHTWSILAGPVTHYCCITVCTYQYNMNNITVHVLRDYLC